MKQHEVIYLYRFAIGIFVKLADEKVEDDVEIEFMGVEIPVNIDEGKTSKYPEAALVVDDKEVHEFILIDVAKKPVPEPRGKLTPHDGRFWSLPDNRKSVAEMRMALLINEISQGVEVNKSF